VKRLVWSELSEAQREAALARPAMVRSEELRGRVREIVAAVRERGDAALREFTERFDGVKLDSLKVGTDEIAAAVRQVKPEILEAMRGAIGRLRAFHQAQVPQDLRVETEAGVICERRFSPVARVGLYIPGGTAPLPSTVMMLGVPSQIAACPLRVLVTPPRKDGTIDPHILAAAHLLGLDQIYKAGGAQAIAALAYGTESIPKVDKIFGPGNSFVTEAKVQVAQDPRGAALDLPAGPSEVLVIADASANPAFVASDLLSQAEHGTDSQVLLISDSAEAISAVFHELEAQLAALPRRAIAAQALQHSCAILSDDLLQAFEISNRYAPEHLILQTRDARAQAGWVRSAGSVFIGPYSPESVGDYSSGTNHVLPTYGFASAYSGVTTESFLKATSFQELTAAGLQKIGPGVELLAAVEGLQAHKNAVTLRLRSLE
jgi:histidinol dehydrogenase